MRRFFKVLTILIFILVGAMVILGFWLRHHYPPERIRKMAADTLGARLGRQVEIADAQLSLLGGMVLKGIRVSEAPTFSAGTFVEVDSVRILPRLIPLLSRQIIVRSIELNRPRLTVRRSSEGIFNFDDLLTPPRQPSAQEKSAPTPVSWSKFLISRATLTEGEITYVDEKLPLTVVFSDLDTRISGFSLSDPFSAKVNTNLHILQGKSSWKGPLSFQARLSPVGDKTVTLENLQLGLGASSLDLSGTLTPLPTPHANVTVKVISIAASDLATFFPLPDPVNDLRLAGQWAVQASPSHVDAKGTFDAQSPHLALSGSLALNTDGEIHHIRLGPKSFRLEESPLAPEVTASGPLTGQWDIVVSTSQWKITGDMGADGALLSYDEWVKKPEGALFTLKATAEKKDAKAPTFDVDLRAPTLDLAPGGPWPQELHLSGPIGITTDLKGTPSDINFALSVDGQSLDAAWGASFRKPQEDTFSLSVSGKFRNQKDLDLSSALLRTNAGTGDIQGDIRDLMNSRSLNLTVKGKIPDLAKLGNLLPALSDHHLRGQTDINAAVKGPADAPTVTGQIHLLNAAITPFTGLDLSEIKGTVNFSPDHAVIDTLHGTAFGSPFTLSGKVDHFDRPTIFLDGNWDRLEIEKLLKVFSPTTIPPSSPSTDSISPPPPSPQVRPGNKHPDLPSSPPTSPIAQATGVFHIGEISHPHYLGRDFQFRWDLTNVGPDLSLLSGTASVTAATGEIKDVPVAKKINKLLNREGSDITYKKLAGKFLVNQGVAEVQSFVLNSDQTDFSAQGRVRLGDMESDLKLMLKLPPGSVRGSVGNWITADDGRPTIEAELKGPLKDPKVKVDYSDTVRRAAQDILKKTLGGWKGKPAPPDEKTSPESPSQPSKDPLQDFGRRAIDRIFKNK
jgi:uncharacterized protein involved in outer membrane biogenesis